MPSPNKLPDVIHAGGVSRPEQLLLCLAELGEGTHSVAAIRKLAGNLGVSDANTSRDLQKLKGLAFQNSSGWTLTSQGARRVAELIGSPDSHIQAQISSLRKLLPKLDPGIQDFVTETIASFETKHFRAAVVLSWIGAVSLLYNFVIRNRLADFNNEAIRRDSKWRIAKTEDDLARMKEYDFLQVIESLSIIGRNIKVELEACLKLRNSCGHPNSLKVGESRCAAHLEVLILNVFSVYA